MADRAPFIHAGANTTPQWNNNGTLTAAVTGDFIVYHYFANPMVGGWSIFGRPHNAKYTSLAAALAARPTQLIWSNYAELKHIYTAIFRVNTGWSNSHRCKLVSLSDYRTVAGTPVAATAPTNHAGLSGLELAGAGVTWGHINDQPQTIAGLKTLDGGALIKGATSAVAAGYVGELKLLTARSESLTTSSPAWSVVGVGSLVDLTAGKWLLICRYDISASATSDTNTYVALSTSSSDDAGGIVTNETANIQYFDSPLGTLSCIVDAGASVSIYGKATAPSNGTIGIAFATGSIGWAFRIA
jgi:hypothetical protein